MNTRNLVRRSKVWSAVAGMAAGLGALVPTVGRAAEPVKELHVTVSGLPVQRVIWKPGTTGTAFTPRGPGCASVSASVANQFNNIDTGSEITLQAGMVQGEGFGSTYVVPDPVPGTTTINEAFPVEINLVEFIAGTAAAVSGSNGSLIRLGWSLEVWDGEPFVGTSSVVFSVDSDPDPSSTGLPPDIMLQRAPGGPCDELSVLLGGAPASAAKMQFSVDNTAAPTDRMLVPGDATDSSGNKLNSFTVVVRIHTHNQPGATQCSSVSVCNNAFLATEGSSVNGSPNPASPTFPARNWLVAIACSGGAPAGYTRFSNLSSTFRPSRDVLQQVTYTPSVCAGAVTGACCAAAGTCTTTTQTVCTGTSAYQGDNTTCQPNPCPQPSGACCSAAGACSIATSGACVGTFVGVGTTCGAQSCAGACCFGTACLTAAPTDCAGAGGTYQGAAAACTAGACPTGACCIAATGACSISTPAACAASGGAYGGAASACNTTFCPLPTGACCASNGFCLSGQTQSACVNAGFSWRGGGTVCSPSPCAATGICCRGATCATGVAQGSCTAPGTGIGAAFVSSASVCNATNVLNAPCCYADFNKSAGISVQDIFDFLNAWFAGSPYCKVAGDGVAVPAVQDIFTFLNAWFAGC